MFETEPLQCNCLTHIPAEAYCIHLLFQDLLFFLQKMSVSSGPSLQDDFSNIPLADDDPQGMIQTKTQKKQNRTLFSRQSKKRYIVSIPNIHHFTISAVIEDNDTTADLSLASDAMVRGRSMDSIQSTFTNGSSSPGPSRKCSVIKDLVFVCPYQMECGL
jgi:hypothetical protein